MNISTFFKHHFLFTIFALTSSDVLAQSTWYSNTPTKHNPDGSQTEVNNSAQSSKEYDQMNTGLRAISVSKDDPRFKKPVIIHLGIGTNYVGGVLPDSVYCGTLNIGSVQPHWRFSTSLTYCPQKDFALSEQVSTKISMFWIKENGCYLFKKGRMEVGPCFGLEFGQMMPKPGEGVVTSTGDSSSDQIWAAGSASIFSTVRIAKPLYLVMYIEEAVPLIKPTLLGTSGEEVFSPASLSTRAGIGGEFRF